MFFPNCRSQKSCSLNGSLTLVEPETFRSLQLPSCTLGSPGCQVSSRLDTEVRVWATRWVPLRESSVCFHQCSQKNSIIVRKLSHHFQLPSMIHELSLRYFWCHHLAVIDIYIYIHTYVELKNTIYGDMYIYIYTCDVCVCVCQVPYIIITIYIRRDIEVPRV